MTPLTEVEIGQLLGSHLARLAAVPCHGNRELTASRLFQALLLSFYEPMTRSLRTIEDAGDFDGRIDLPKLARSTTSDALAACDPSLLMPVIGDLQNRIPGLHKADASLNTITRRIIAGDGTYFTTLAAVAWVLKHKTRDGKEHGQFRANVQMDVRTWVPQVITVSGDDNESEPKAFSRDLVSDVIYVCDRNFVEFDFFKAVLKAKSQFVIRARSNAPSVRVVRTRPLTGENVAAGVTEDADVVLTGLNAPAGVFRQTIFTYVNRGGETETCRIISTLTEPEITASIIAEIYRLRWQIELFFRWLKVYARMGRLISTSRQGITWQLHVMVIAVLLMYVRTGTRVSIYALAAFARVSNGTQTIEQALAVIAMREKERLQNRARQARKRAMQKPTA